MKIFDFEKNFVITRENALEYADKIGKFLKDYLKNSGMFGYVLGLSGGLDSAVVAYLCARAGINLYLLMLPDGISMRSGSAARANEVIDNLGLRDKSFEIDISPYCNISDGKRAALAAIFPPEEHPHNQQNMKLASENCRARIRMCLLFDFAQVHRLLVLGTDNTDEHFLGYFTKYGDGASDIEPIQYLLKSEVRILGEALGVPRSILDCAPSAELSSGQTDEADLGFAYDDFDNFALNGTSGSADIDAKIVARYNGSRHKRKFPDSFHE